MNKKGFTLVELLAVIVILGVIALIVSPIVTGVIKKSKDSAAINSSYQYEEAAELYVSEATGNNKNLIYSNMVRVLDVTGTTASGGYIKANKDGEIAYGLILDDRCVVKSFSEQSASISEDKSLCSSTVIPPTSCFNYEKLTASDLSTYNNLLSVGDIVITGYSCGDTLKTYASTNDFFNPTHSVFNNDGTYTDIEIPSTIDGSPVTGIDEYAFLPYKGAQTSNRNIYNIKPSFLGTKQNDIEPSLLFVMYNYHKNIGIHTLVLPSSMKYIGDVSFGFNEVEKLTFSSDKIYIGFGAFMLNSLTSLDLPNDSTLGLESFAFNNITSFTLKKSYTRTDNSLGLFMGNKISSLTIEDGVTAIGDTDFAFNNIKSVTIPSSVTTIGDGSFGYNKLTDITIPSSVTSIGGAAFNCNDVPVDKAIIYARNTDGTENKTTIVSYAHTGGTVTVPTTVTTLSAQSFSAVGLTSITIPSSVTSIGAGALANNSLTSVTIPNSVTSIGEDAFSDNTLLKTISIDNTSGTITGSPWGATNATITYLR